MISQQKKELRQLILSKRNALAKDLHAAASALLSEQLIGEVRKLNPKTIHSFLPMGSEVDIRPFLEFCLNESITVICPETLPKRELRHRELRSLEDLEDGRFGTRFPRGENEFTGEYDLIIVPALAIDRQGVRLGYGGGYYDSFLAEKKAHTLAPIFSFQYVETVPRHAHDVRVEQVLVSEM